MSDTFLKFFNQIRLLFMLSLLTVACGRTKDNGIAYRSSVKLQKLDSIPLPFSGNVAVHDIDPLHRTVLLAHQDSGHHEIIVMGFNGEVRSVLPTEDLLPDGQTGLLAPMKINGSDSFVAYTVNGFSAFDVSGKLLSTLAHPTTAIRASNFSMGEGMEKFGNRMLSNNPGEGKVGGDDLKLNRNPRLLVWLDTEKKEIEPFLSFPEGSIFRHAGSFFKDAWKPVFTIGDDRLFVAFGIEPVIYAYRTSPPYSLTSSIPLDLPEYQYTQRMENKKSRLDYFELPFASGRILNIKSVKGHFVVAYFPGVDPRDANVYTGASTRELVHVSREIQKKYPKRIAVFDSLGNLVNDYIPTGLDPNSMVLRNGELWMIGRDPVSLFKVGLTFERD